MLSPLMLIGAPAPSHSLARKPCSPISRLQPPPRHRGWGFPAGGRHLYSNKITAASRPVEFRGCTSSDSFTISSNIFKERMNPLGLDPTRFLAAVSPGTGDLVGFGQIKNLGSEEEPVLEMASVVVLEPFRGQGIGTVIIEKLAEESKKSSPGQQLHLLTLEKSMPFYERCGWREAQYEEVPTQLRVELGLGTVVAGVVAKDRCVAMVLPQ